MVTVYKNIHKARSHMYSDDSAIQAIATQNTLPESQLHCALFQPHQEVVEAMIHQSTLLPDMPTQLAC